MSIAPSATVLVHFDPSVSPLSIGARFVLSFDFIYETYQDPLS